jgi:hypothetical protein
VYGSSHCLLKIDRWLPPEFSNLVGVKRITPVVSGSVLYKGYHLLSKPEGVQDDSGYLKVCALLTASNIVYLPRAPLVDYKVNCPAVILYIQPVPYVQSIAVQWEFPATQGIGDEQGD